MKIKPYCYIEFTDYIYIKLKGMIWIYNGLTNPNNVNKDTGDALKKLCSDLTKNKTFIIDCKGVNNVTDRSWDSFFVEINNTNREIIFINSNGLNEHIERNIKEFCPTKTKLVKDNHITIYSKAVKVKFEESIENIINKKIISNIHNYVKESFSKYENNETKYLRSTPILATGEFNAFIIINNPEYFYWTSLVLADLVDNIIKEKKVGSFNQNPRILSVSLRSSPFANIISLLLNCYLETIDHFGPINKFFEINNLNNDGIEYIFIGDFVFGGTEIKIAKNYAIWNNAKLENAVAIGSLFDKSVYSDINLDMIVLLKDLSEDAIYKLYN